MAMRAAAHTILVTPTGDNNDRQIGALFVAGDPQKTKIYRGVVESVGEHVVDGCEIGNVLHYTSFFELDDKHIVPSANVLAFEDDS